MKKMRLVIFVYAAFAILPRFVHAADLGPSGDGSATEEANDSRMPVTERVFAKLHSTNLHEITASNLALNQGSAPEVKGFAQEMYREHTAAEQQLVPLAESLRVRVQEYQPRVGRESRQETMDREAFKQLRQLNGAAFDRMYAASQVEMHRQLMTWLFVRQFQIQDPQAREFVQSQLRTVWHNYRMALALEFELSHR